MGPISKEATITKTGAEELSPSPGQVETLECAAVWDPDFGVARRAADGRPVGKSAGSYAARGATKEGER
jgi:hypothetical protein